MICKYCQLIHSVDGKYPLREATRDLNSDFPRCEWHWRFVCGACGKPRHFNGVTWCERTRKFICLHCGTDHRLLNGDFWIWRTYYAIGCHDCDERHPALDRLEFQGEHPWQLHSEMLMKRVGLSPENEVQIVPHSTYVPAEENPVTEEQIAEAWDMVTDKWNSKYTEFGDSNRQFIIDPAIFRILGEVEGLQILDAGCGNGYLCRLLANKGAKMIGIDISRRAIEIAEIREKQAPLGIKYHVGSICNLSMFKDQTFDFIVSNLVLMDAQELNKATKELHRVLKTKGKLVFSIMHPCFSSPPVHGWEKKPIDSDRKEDWIYWKVDRYFDRTREDYRYFDFPPTYSFHRTLSDYIKALISNGFTITDFEEPVPSKKDMKEHYREFGNECERVPWFLIISAKK